MQPPLLPLFPLRVVLLPGGELPLHIFEDRYKEMMREVIREQPEIGLEFGVVLAHDKGIVNIGCTAVVDRVVKRYPDGRLDIETRGRRRFEIVSLNDERAFLRGVVDFFDDDDVRPASAEIVERALEGFFELQRLTESSTARSQDDRHPLSFQLAQLVPDLGVRQILLTTRNEADRMRHLSDFFPAYLKKERQIRHVQKVAPKNGHGGSHA